MRAISEYYRETAIEFIGAIFFSQILFILLPSRQLVFLQQALIYFLTPMPLTFVTVFSMNFLNVLFIFLCAIFDRRLVGFFVGLNGVALSIIFSVYHFNFYKFIRFLFPHMIFETFLIILFCSHTKKFVEAWKMRNEEIALSSFQFIFYRCLPLLFMSAILEAIFHIW